MCMFHKSQITELDDAVLVSFYRCLKCGRGSEVTKQEMIEICEAEIASRGIDLGTFRGNTGFVS
jgi:hypothetical protein